VTVGIVILIVTWAAVLLAMLFFGWFRQRRATTVRCDSTPALTAPLLPEDVVVPNGFSAEGNDAGFVVEDAPATTPASDNHISADHAV
jgi:hypothetical protein